MRAAAKAAREAFNAAVEGKRSHYDTVFAYKRPIDGRIAWVHALGHVQRDADGKATDMYGVSQDITEFQAAGGGTRNSEGNGRSRRRKPSPISSPT